MAECDGVRYGAVQGGLWRAAVVVRRAVDTDVCVVLDGWMHGGVRERQRQTEKQREHVVVSKQCPAQNCSGMATSHPSK